MAEHSPKPTIHRKHLVAAPQQHGQRADAEPASKEQKNKDKFLHAEDQNNAKKVQQPNMEKSPSPAGSEPKKAILKKNTVAKKINLGVSAESDNSSLR